MFTDGLLYACGRLLPSLSHLLTVATIRNAFVEEKVSVFATHGIAAAEIT